MTDPALDHDAQVDADERPLLEHLLELRARLLRVVLAVLVAFFPFYAYSNEIYRFIAEPLIAHLPSGSSMIATEVASPFLTPFKLALVAAVFATVPYWLHQAWAFIAPGLYRKEKRFAVPLLVSSVLLFYLGVAFAYFLVFPLVFGFFTSIGPSDVAIMTDISRYLDFVLKMFFAFGAAFEIPIATVLLVWSGISSTQSLRDKRPYVIVGCFVVGMLLTPPDVISQILLAVPMWALFEAGLLAARLTERPVERDDTEAAAVVPTGPGDPTTGPQ